MCNIYLINLKRCHVHTCYRMTCVLLKKDMSIYLYIDRYTKKYIKIISVWNLRINKNKQNKFKTNKTTFLNVFNERKGWNIVFLYRLNNRWNIRCSLCLVQALLAAPWTAKVPGSFKPFSDTWFMVFWREKTSY